MSAVRWTSARWRGLEVLAATGHAQVSNFTGVFAGESHVYWMTSDWLIVQGFARFPLTDPNTLHITDEGRAELARVAGS